MDEIDKVLEECRQIEKDFLAKCGFKSAPAPAPFKRAAILCRKSRDLDGEIAICRRWIALEETYSSQNLVRQGKAANVAAGPTARHLRARLEKLLR